MKEEIKDKSFVWVWDNKENTRPMIKVWDAQHKKTFSSAGCLRGGFTWDNVFPVEDLPNDILAQFLKVLAEVNKNHPENFIGRTADGVPIFDTDYNRTEVWWYHFERQAVEGFWIIGSLKLTEIKDVRSAVFSTKVACEKWALEQGFLKKPVLLTTSKDGFEIFEGDEFFAIHESGTKVVSSKEFEIDIHSGSVSVFKHLKNAQEELDLRNYFQKMNTMPTPTDLMNIPKGWVCEFWDDNESEHSTLQFYLRRQAESLLMQHVPFIKLKNYTGGVMYRYANPLPYSHWPERFKAAHQKHFS